MEEKVYELLSVDLWDTVIRRKCHPDAIKTATSEYLFTNYFEYIVDDFRDINSLTESRVSCERQIGEKTSQSGIDDEYEIHDVMYMWIGFVMPQYNDVDKLVDEIYNYELKKEIENAYLDPTIVDTINNIPHKQLAYVSDFYAGIPYIDAVLNAINCPLTFDKKYISCECGYNKRSGRLFEYVLNDLNINSNEQMHLGDNQYSDVEVPSNKEINVMHYVPKHEHELRQEKEKEYNTSKKLPDVDISKTGVKAKGNISIFFYGFISWIIESCVQDSIEKVYFFTREGEFYKQIYDEIVKYDKTGRRFPKAEILEVSRIATFCASLREITLNELMRIWNQYSVQPLSALFKSLDIEKDLVINYVKKYNIDWDEIITYPWLDERVIELFKDNAFILLMEKERDAKKEILLKYLKQKGIDFERGEKIAIVDIGWRGTIQDNISYLLPDHIIKGYYIGLIQFLNEQPDNVIKRGYLNGCKKFNLLLQYVMPFEMICNSPNGSTVGYELREEGVVAIRKKEQEEDWVYYKYIEDIQREILHDMSALCESISAYYIDGKIRKLAHIMLEDYILRPQRIVADAYFSLKHNEEFGVGEYVDKTTCFRLDLLLKAFGGSKQRSKLAQFLRDTTWPQGYLVKYYLYPILKLYNDRYASE